MHTRFPQSIATAARAAAVLRAAILCDYAEEQWPSMDLVGEMLVESLNADSSLNIAAARIRPAMPGAMARLHPHLHTADRLTARLYHYPRHVRTQREAFHVFHVVDHSYSQLVHELPEARTVVTCHDLDTFRCLLQPERERRSWPFRRMTARILAGLRKAARVICVSEATRIQLLQFGLVEPSRALVIHNGVHPVFSPRPDAVADDRVRARLGLERPERVELLHVGSTIPRKRIDLLLQVVAAVRRRLPQTRLMRVGGALTPPQARLAQKLGLTDAVDSFPYLDRCTLAALYRRASVVLLTSDAEGFGLPIIEALACGAPVIASDIPAAREVGGPAVLYCPRGDVPAWTEAILERIAAPRFRCPDAHWPDLSVAQAARFSWKRHAFRLAAVYHQILADSGGTESR